MKKVFYLFIVSLLIFSGSCRSVILYDTWSTYTFKVKNSTQEIITLKFLSNPSFFDGYDENNEEVILLPAEEKIVRLLGDAKLNSPAYDCLTDPRISFSNELVFDTYVNDEKLEKQLWQAENWTYSHISKWLAEYSMTITNEMIEK